MSSFTVVLCTAAPPGFPADLAGGAYLKVDGREALLKSADLFANREEIKQVVLVVSPNKADEAKQKFGAHLGFSGIKLIVAGPGWFDQLKAAAPHIAPETTHVIVHDAARPAVSYSDIDAMLSAADESAVVALSQPIRAEIVELDEGGQPVGMRSSREFAQLVTPVSHNRETFQQMADGKAVPHASQIKLLNGAMTNLRLNHAGDVGIVSAMLKLLPKPKSKSTGTPFDEAQW